MDFSLSGSSVHGILQARILEWVGMPFSGDLPDPGVKPISLTSPALEGGFFLTLVPLQGLPRFNSGGIWGCGQERETDWKNPHIS